MRGLTPLYVPLRSALCCDHLLGISPASQWSYAPIFSTRKKEDEEINIYQLWLRKFIWKCIPNKQSDDSWCWQHDKRFQCQLFTELKQPNTRGPAPIMFSVLNICLLSIMLEFEKLGMFPLLLSWNIFSCHQVVLGKCIKIWKYNFAVHKIAKSWKKNVLF